jgi:hypothetical protein
MFRSQYQDYGELRPNSVAVPFNRYICFGRIINIFVIECNVMFILVQTTDGANCISRNAVLPGYCS